MKITGLDKLQRELDEFARAMKELDGDIASVSFDPFSPESIEQAIAAFEATVDEKAGAYMRNEMVRSVVAQLKEQGRRSILEKAAAGRLEKDSESEK